MTTIQLNGKPVEVPDRTSVEGLVKGRGLAPEEVAVELNLRLVPRAQRGGVLLSEGDQVELVTLVGGG